MTGVMGVTVRLASCHLLSLSFLIPPPCLLVASRQLPDSFLFAVCSLFDVSGLVASPCSSSGFVVFAPRVMAGRALPATSCLRSHALGSQCVFPPTALLSFSGAFVLLA